MIELRKVAGIQKERLDRTYPWMSRATSPIALVLLVQARSGLIPDEAFTDVKADDLVLIKNSCYDFIGLRKSSR